MKKNIDKYPNVDTLPDSAITVKEYADQRGFNTSYIYELIRNHKNKDFEIVVFRGYNFIIPLTIN